MNTKFKYLKEGVTSDIVEYLIEDYQMSLHEALSVLYESDTYAKLCEPQTGLYFQSSRYVYSYLQDELASGQLQ